MRLYYGILKKVILSMVLVLFIFVINDSENVTMGGLTKRTEVPSSMNPVGSGARALGMGGAFIGVADDATAASWNPGGLIQLEGPELSIVVTAFSRKEENRFGTNPEASGRESTSQAGINYLSLAYPFTLRGHNMIVSANYQTLYDFERKWNFMHRESAGNIMSSSSFDYKQKGALSPIGLAFCAQITPVFSAGITLNIWKEWLDEMGWEEISIEKNTGTHNGKGFIYESQITHDYSMSGINANLGFLWQMNKNLTLGAVFKSQFEADIIHRYSWRWSIDYLNDTDPPVENPYDNIYNEKLDMPMSYGLGIAYRFSDVFTASFDIYRTEWDDFIYKDANGDRYSPVTGHSTDISETDATCQIRFGTEYLLIHQKYVLPLRCGIFYDPAPAKGHPDDFYGLSIGAGIAIGGFIFDIAYQYRFGRDVREYILYDFDFSQHVNEHTVYTSMILHF